MAPPRQLIDWHTHCYLPEHMGAESRAVMQARGVIGGEAWPEHHQRGVIDGGAEKFVVIKMPTKSGRGIPNDFIAEYVGRYPGRAVGFAAIDSQAAGPLMQQAKTDKIPVIAFDSGVDSDVPVTTASTDNLAAAAEAAKHMADLIGHEGKIAMVVHDQTSVTGVQRRDGFKDYMTKNEPKIQIVDIQYSGDPLKATDLAKAIIAAHPDLKGLYGSNEGAAIGVVHAVQELGIQGKLKIIGFDSGKDQIDAIKSGLMSGAITQNPVGIGYETVKAAVDIINGKTVPKNIDTGYYWYDKTNIDDAKIAAVLYQ